MAMTKLEKSAKEQVIEILQEQGYPTYARLFNLFDLNLTEDPGVIGYMEPGKARIVLNSGLSINQVSVVVRHEILHEYFTHGEREKEYIKTHKRNVDHNLSNIAADYEISNRGYTDADKVTVRAIILNNEVLSGLVTEDKHADWVNMTYEEMLDKLLEDEKNIQNSTKPQIGDKGNENIQNSEQVEREAQAAKEEAEEQSNSSDPSEAEEGEENKEKATELQRQAQAAHQQAQKNEKNKDPEDVFPTAEQQKKDAELAKRIQEIQRELNNIRNGSNLEKEATNAIEKEKVAKAAKDLKKYNNSANTRFAISLSNFIKRATAIGREKTWRRFNKNYVGSGLLKPGISNSTQAKVPLINVYFDRSGSFSGHPEKTKGAEEAIGALNHYVRRGQIKLKLYYVAMSVESDREVAEDQGGGANGEAILRHIQATKPDNVIILTDSDANVGNAPTVSVPGAVYLLFYEDRADSLIEHFKGYKELKTFFIEV